MADPVCPRTGFPMRRDVRPMTIAYKGVSKTFDMPGWYCDASQESIHTSEDMKVSDRELTKLRAQVEGLLKPDEIRRVRKKLKLSQREAGRLIGGGPNAFQKYESGEVLTSRAVSNLLRILARHPEELGSLKLERDRELHGKAARVAAG